MTAEEARWMTVDGDLGEGVLVQVDVTGHAAELAHLRRVAVVRARAHLGQVNVELREAGLTRTARVTNDTLTAHRLVVEGVVEPDASIPARIGRGLPRNRVAETASILSALPVAVATELLGRDQWGERSAVLRRAWMTCDAGEVVAEVVAVFEDDLVPRRPAIACAGAQRDEHEEEGRVSPRDHSASSGR
jgi:hypothetical protein